MFRFSSTFNIMGKPFSFYTLFAFTGLYMGILVGLMICRKRNLEYSFVFRMLAGVLLIGLITEIFVNKIPKFMLSFSYILGLTLATSLFAIIGKIFHKNVRGCCEVGLIAANTYMMFSKIGCFVAGCCHGQPFNAFFSVIYTSRSHAFLQGVPLFPIQLVEVLVRLIVLGIMLILYYKDIFHRYRVPLFFCLMGNSYFWGMLFWYEPMRTINQNGINFILIFNIVFGVGTLMCILLQLSEKVKHIKYPHRVERRGINNG